MKKIAIDVVLLPSEEMVDKAIEINKELLKDYENKIVLDKQKCLPHISLCMGCVNEEDIPEIENVLRDISLDFSKINLSVDKLEKETIPTGKIVSGMSIVKTDMIQSLHEDIMKKLWKFLSYEPEISMLFNPPEVEEVTLYWIKNYKDKYNNSSLFSPHITVGFGETDKFQFPISFTASKLAMCQLGNYCTCRKVLFSHNLK